MNTTVQKGISDRHRRRRHLALVVVMAVAASTLVRMASRHEPAEAAIDTYRRISRNFAGFNNANVPLGTRGSLDDSCVIHPTLSCRTQATPWKARHEATAQALATPPWPSSWRSTQ